jgi:hypothetical protein
MKIKSKKMSNVCDMQHIWGDEFPSKTLMERHHLGKQGADGRIVYK